MAEHAILSPSGADRWMVCAGSVILSAGLPNPSNKYSREGTAAHTLASRVMEDGSFNTAQHIGTTIAVEGYQIKVDADMVRHVQTYVDNIRQYAAPEGAVLFVEQRVPIDHLTGEENAGGTGDTVILIPLADGSFELQMHDLKYGTYKVSAEKNRQLRMYALGGLREFSYLGTFTRARLVIHQPRLDHVDEWDCAIEELTAFATGEITPAVARVEDAHKAVDLRPYLNPGEKQCRYCPAAQNSTCPALDDEIEDVTGVSFTDLISAPVVPIELAALEAKMSKVELVEKWCKNVRAELERQLFSGVKFENWKLVMGRKGARTWADPAAAEIMLRKKFRMKIEDVFNMQLKTPPVVEKALAKAAPKRWAALQPLIQQRDGVPSVAPAADERDTWVAAPEFSFENYLSTTESVL